MVDKDVVRRRRANPVTIPLGLEEGDELHRTISRPNGIFLISHRRILRIRSDDILDPAAEHTDVPWERSVYLPHGSSDAIVARTVLQTEKLAEVFVHDRGRSVALKDISWEVMNSLVSLRHIRSRLEKQIEAAIKQIESDLDGYTKGQSPKPLPYIPYLDIEYLSYVNEVRRLLSKVSEVFGALTDFKVEKGHFHKALPLLKQTYGPDSPVARMLESDLKWIEVWIKIRVAIEHPKPDQYVETLNFGLDPDRRVRLPTWRFVHPDYPEMARPQNMTDVLEILEANLLKFFEDLQVSLLPPVRVGPFEAHSALINELDRDPKAPMRYAFGHSERS